MSQLGLAWWQDPILRHLLRCLSQLEADTALKAVQERDYFSKVRWWLFPCRRHQPLIIASIGIASCFELPSLAASKSLTLSCLKYWSVFNTCVMTARGVMVAPVS